MKRLITIFITGITCTGCSFSSWLQSSVFEDVWKDNVNEYIWSTSEKMSQVAAKNDFLAWATEFEKKRDTFVRKDEDGKLQGSTVLLGKNLERTRKEYQASLKKLESIIQLQGELKKQTGIICQYQKSSVQCDL